MSVELTDELIREFLDDIGLPQVDPTQFRTSTLDELIRASIDLGRIRPVQVNSLAFRQVITTPAELITTITIGAPNPTEVQRWSNFFVAISTSNIDQLEIFKLDAVIEESIWHDDASPITASPGYIGGPNISTQAWGNKVIDIYGTRGNVNNLQQQLTIRLSGAAVVKSIIVAATVDTYEFTDWPGY